jgi:uncharacterized protein YkwD
MRLSLPLAALATLLIALSLSASAPSSAAARGCKHVGALPGTIRQHAYEKAIICLTNVQRHKRGLKKLDNDKRLHKAASRHNRYMLKRNCFDHQCQGEKDLVGRLRGVGYVADNIAWMVGENIAWGELDYGTPKAIVRAWMHSPDHRHNILESDYRDIGVAVDWGRPGSGTRKAATVTQDFGRRG